MRCDLASVNFASRGLHEQDSRPTVRKEAFANVHLRLILLRSQYFLGASVLELCSEPTDATVENSFSGDTSGFLKGSVDFLETAKVLAKRKMKSN